MDKKVERWGMFEAEVKGPSEGNPFTEHQIRGVFKSENEVQVNRINVKKTDIGWEQKNDGGKCRECPNLQGIHRFYKYKVRALLTTILRKQEIKALFCTPKLGRQ